MGSSTSKAAKTAAGASRRQYPQRVPPAPTSNKSPAHSPPAGQPSAPGPTVHPDSWARETRDERMSPQVTSETERLMYRMQPSRLTLQTPISPAPFALLDPFSPILRFPIAPLSPMSLLILPAPNLLPISHIRKYFLTNHRILPFWC